MPSYGAYYAVLAIIWLTVWGSVFFWLWARYQRKSPLWSTRYVAFALPVAILIVAGLQYVLSYAPFAYYKHRREAYVMGERTALAPLEKLYVPVQWLIDFTPARDLLLKWADRWDVGNRLRIESNNRQLYRQRNYWGPYTPWYHAIVYLSLGSLCAFLPPHYAYLCVVRIRDSRRNSQSPSFSPNAEPPLS
jgi:hypothetical protein